MTIIQPHRASNTLNWILLILVFVLVASVIMLVVIYNHLVNVNHSISRASAEIKRIRTESAELNDAIFALFDDQKLAELAVARNLVKDRAPQYIELREQWSIAYER